MTYLTFDREIAHTRSVIDAMRLSAFAVPHLVVDDVFPPDLVDRIAENWPTSETFQPEVPGNHVYQMFRADYGRMADQVRPFWEAFNEKFWPTLVAAVAKAFQPPCEEVFGALYKKHLSLDHPLTLMQADPSFPGHDMHQHFYHAPHWAFTMLLYIDPEDTESHGTALHRLRPRSGVDDAESSYLHRDSDWRAEVAMETFHWLDPNRPERRYEQRVVDYRSNRLFVFMDGPLALHSVPRHDVVSKTMRERDGGRYARRRVLRSHVKVHHHPFYMRHSRRLRETFEPVSYMRLMAPNAASSRTDDEYRDTVLREFFGERIRAYARAAERLRTETLGSRVRAIADRVVGRAQHDFLPQVANQLPYSVNGGPK